MARDARQRKLFGLLGKAGHLLFWAGLASTAYTLVTVYLLSGSLLSGACPITASDPWPYISIVLLTLSLILSIFDPKGNRKTDEPHS